MNSKITISKSKMAVTLNGQKVQLSNTAFNLLYYLCTKQGQVLSREEIINTVWVSEYVVPRTVDVHVRKIRVKFGSEVIESVTGKGYKLSPDVKVKIDDKIATFEDATELEDGVMLGVYKDESKNIVAVTNVADSKYGKLVVYMAGASAQAMPVKDFKAQFSPLK